MKSYFVFLGASSVALGFGVACKSSATSGSGADDQNVDADDRSAHDSGLPGAVSDGDGGPLSELANEAAKGYLGELPPWDEFAPPGADQDPTPLDTDPVASIELVREEVEDENGEIVRWSFEAGTPSGMIRNGYSPQVIKEGDMVTIRGFRARNDSNNGMLRELVTSDGTVFGMFGPQEGPGAR